MLRLTFRGKPDASRASSRAFWLRKISLCLFGLSLFVAGPGHARSTLTVGAERIAQGPVEARGLRLSLLAPELPGAGLGLRLKLDSLALDDFGYQFRELDWRCELRPRDVGVWRCVGPLRTALGSAGELSLDWNKGETELSLVRGRARLQASIPAGTGALNLQAERLPSAWLQPALSSLWSAAQFTDGVLGGDLDLDFGLDAPRIEGRVRADDLGLDTRDGLIAAAGLNLQGRIGVELGASTRIGTELSISGGEVLFDRVYASLPAQPIRMELAALGQGDEWQLERLSWNDPEVLQLEASAKLSLQAESPLVDLRLDARSPRAGVLLSRYLDSLLGTLGLPGSSADGALRLRLEQAAGRLRSLVFEPDRLSFADGAGRFSARGLQGMLRWTQQDTLETGNLEWESASLHGLSLEPAKLELASVAGGLALREPARIGLLGGLLELDSFRWRPELQPADQEATEAGDNLALSARLQGIDLAALSTALGWPVFRGELSGEIPGVLYRNRVLSIGGALAMQVFAGEVEVSGLKIERPFGVAPTLVADVVMRSLDLQPVTSVFGFGEITGRMNGYIRDLRLVDWEPVAFDARFETDENSKDRRRISQRAVSDLSSVGGMGAAAALQQSLMRAFENFSYARIGLSCRLQNHVCHMGGLERSGRGYTIVEGAGLPRITVNGVSGQVDWPVLLARLKAVTEGQTPKVQ